MIDCGAYVETHRERLLGLLEDLISIPSVNRSPCGEEEAIQQYIAECLRSAGYEPDVYEPDSVDALKGHALATPGRSYDRRPNVGATCPGSGGGRSLLLSCHVDTVPSGSLPWTREPFAATREGSRIYGRGANDMKAGVAMNLFVMEALACLAMPLAGDITFESVVDEEFGGVNGTLAARLRGYHADAAVITEPSGLRICPAQRGGRTVHLFFTADGGVLEGARQGAGVVEQIGYFLQRLPDFARQRRNNCVVHPLYKHCDDPVPVTVTKLTTGPWGTSEPITVPEEARIELYWQMMPGETQQAVEEEFLEWLDRVVSESEGVLVQRPKIAFPVRWLPGSAIDADSTLCSSLQRAGTMELVAVPPVQGIEGPCDLFVFHAFGIPAVLWGPTGGQTHGADEWVDADSMIAATKVLLRFVVDWCGFELQNPPMETAR